MSASYDETLTGDLDMVRFRLGDTVVEPADAALYSDEAILAALARNTSVANAVSELAAGLVARFATMPDKWSMAGQSFDFSSRLKAWRSLVIPIETTASTTGAWSMVDATYTGDATTDEYAR